MDGTYVYAWVVKGTTHAPVAGQNFHALRVVNDDIVKGGYGFGKHPHRDAEIFTYMIDGQLSHTDSMGNYETLHRGWVQCVSDVGNHHWHVHHTPSHTDLSAGTGITHSEMNDGAEACRLLQIWMLPDRRGHTPQYGSSQYSDKDRADTLLQILHGTGTPPSWPEITRKGTPIHLHQDVNVFVSENQAGRKYELPLAPGRAAYVININGALDVNGVHLEPSDAAEVENRNVDDMPLTLASGDKGSHFMVIEMKQHY